MGVKVLTYQQSVAVSELGITGGYRDVSTGHILLKGKPTEPPRPTEYLAITRNSSPRRVTIFKVADLSAVAGLPTLMTFGSGLSIQEIGDNFNIIATRSGSTAYASMWPFTSIISWVPATGRNIDQLFAKSSFIYAGYTSSIGQFFTKSYNMANAAETSALTSYSLLSAFPARDSTAFRVLQTSGSINALVDAVTGSVLSTASFFGSNKYAIRGRDAVVRVVTTSGQQKFEVYNANNSGLLETVSATATQVSDQRTHDYVSGYLAVVHGIGTANDIDLDIYLGGALLRSYRWTSSGLGGSNASCFISLERECVFVHFSTGGLTANVYLVPFESLEAVTSFAPFGATSVDSIIGKVRSE